MAVDYYGNALKYDGSSWSAPTDVNNQYSLASISCTSSTFCMTVGYGYAIEYSAGSNQSGSKTPGSPNTGLGDPSSSYKFVAALILGLGSIYGISILVNSYRRAKVNR
jgi:hypothetical protein